jgi:large subunit ribosomal protein L24
MAIIKLKIKKGDSVQVITGKDKGKKGVVEKAFPKDRKVLIEGVNVKKVHIKKRQKGAKGQIVDRALPIDISNVKKVK